MTIRALCWVVLVAFIALTICGNILVCMAVATSRRLHQLSSCFILSLAVTDLLLGLLVLPLSAMLELRNGKWPLGGVFCNIYISMDVMLSSASILTLLAISVDRYLAISNPLFYPRRVTPRRVAIALTAIWTCSLAVSFVSINLGWNSPDFRVQNLDWSMWGEGEEGRTCRYEWNNNYVLLKAFGIFYLPLLVMCGMYHRIFCVAREQVRRIRAATPSSAQAANAAATAREHKATVTLAAVLGAFIICWFPYFTYFTYMGMWAIHPNKLTHSIVLWLGYLNSALNPILYPALNRDFHQACGQLLCRCGKKGDFNTSRRKTFIALGTIKVIKGSLAH
ncbi:histamine receptor H2b [Danio rerio]|uniref:Histamine H2 receptor n=1 Tax=Danio rerio TaxID=7955 RepID=A7MBV0_DANRE|nr:histamine receptor H2b [Danio rerio]AAI51926.1 Zgc:171684 protein [Danio rerio]|eukprot:NP_001103208.1 histamine receptor H2b [Danio rerio]